MSKPLLTIGIVLSLGTMGCAGFGLQQGSSVTAQFRQEQGLDNFWRSAERAPTRGLEAPLYAEQGLGRLWDNSPEEPTSVRQTEVYQSRGLGDLWNPGAVTRSWEIDEDTQATPSRGLLFTAESRRERADRAQTVAQ
jgi:hypothetical protein